MGKYTFQVTENTAPKPKPDLTDGSKLGFGTYFTYYIATHGLKLGCASRKMK